MIRIASLVTSMLFLSLLLPAQPNSKTIVDEVTNWISQSDIQSLTNQFDANLQMNILEKENFHSKAQASILVKDFFKTHPVSGFSVQHKGGGDANLFMIGKLLSGSEEFRVSIHFRKVGGSDRISFFSIEQNKTEKK